MTIGEHGFDRALRVLFLGVAPGSFCVGAPALADTRAGVDVSAGASLETNPYLVDGTGTDVAASADIAPWLQISDEVSSLDIRGNLSVRQFSRSANGTDVSGSVGVTGSHRLSPYASVSGGLNYFTSRNGINQGFLLVGPDDPLPPITAPLPDTTLAGTRTRTQSFTSNVGVSLRLSERDQLGVSFSAARSTYNSPAGRDFSFLNGGLNYSRTLNERISLTASVRYGRSEYDDTRIGDGTILTPDVGIDMKISSRVSLSASLGASIARSNGLFGTTIKTTSLAGNVRLCRQGERGAACIVAARSAQPTGFGGISTVTSISALYNTQLSQRDNLSFNLGFSGTSDSFSLPAGNEKSRYYTAGATWSHNFSPRFSTYVSPGAARITNSLQSYNTFRLSAGLTYRFGAIQ